MKLLLSSFFVIVLLFSSRVRVLLADDEEDASENDEVEAAAEVEPSSTQVPTSTVPPRYVPYPKAGILVQYTQSGLDYIIGMVERTTVKLMRDFPIPDAEQGSFSIKKVKVLQFDDPKITSRFLNQTGILINTTIPKLVTSAAYSTGSGWFGTSGAVKSSVEGLVISMLVRVIKGETGYPSLKVQHCSGSVRKFGIAFQGAGWTGTVLNSLRAFMESIFVTSMGDVFCFAARNLTGLIETVFLDFDKPMSEILSKAIATDSHSQQQQQQPDPAALDMKTICGEEPSAAAESAPVVKRRKGAGGIASSVVAEMEGLTLDMKMNDDGFFEDDQMVIGLRADFVHEGKAAGLEPRDVLLSKTDRSMCFAVSEIVPNSFGVQAQENAYFVLKKKIDVSDLPLEIRVPLRVICPNCNMQLYATTSEAPRVEFARSGVRSWAKTFLMIDGRGIFNTKIKVVEAVADIETLVNLYIRQNTVYGNVSLGSIQIKLRDVGIGGIFDKPLNAMLRKLVPKVIWPVVQKRLNKMLREKGFKLPAVCGLSFNNTEIVYADGSVVVCTDIIYDLDGFLNRFTEWQWRQQGKTMPPSTVAATPSIEETESPEPTTIRILTVDSDDGLT